MSLCDDTVTSRRVNPVILGISVSEYNQPPSIFIQVFLQLLPIADLNYFLSIRK